MWLSTGFPTRLWTKSLFNFCCHWPHSPRVAHLLITMAYWTKFCFIFIHTLLLFILFSSSFSSPKYLLLASHIFPSLIGGSKCLIIGNLSNIQLIEGSLLDFFVILHWREHKKLLVSSAKLWFQWLKIIYYVHGNRATVIEKYRNVNEKVKWKEKKRYKCGPLPTAINIERSGGNKNKNGDRIVDVGG